MDSNPYPDAPIPQSPIYQGQHPWPACWISLPNAAPPVVAAYALAWEQPEPATLRVHVSADERFELWHNGRRVRRGPERSRPAAWAFHTCDIPAARGPNTLAARVWSLGSPHSPAAQLSVVHGFFLAPDSPSLRNLLSTGFAPWRARALPGRAFLPKGPCFGTSAFERCSAEAGDIEWRTGGGGGWTAPATGQAGTNSGAIYRGADEHRLAPGQLPPMMEQPFSTGTLRHLSEPASDDPVAEPFLDAQHLAEEAASWQAWWNGGAPLTIPPNTRRRALFDLDGYFCAYLELHTVRGRGAAIRWNWEEALYTEPRRGDALKSQRDTVEGRHFLGFGDTFLPGGQPAVFDTLWWRCGRYVEIIVHTAGEPLTLVRKDLRETRYPYASEAAFESSDKAFDRSLPLLERGQAMCAHETFFDCPYYEQLQYAGDSFIQALVILATTHDARLVRKALYDAHSTRREDGMIDANFAGGGGMVIPTFGLFWVAGLHDYLLYRLDPATLRDLLPGARATLDFWLRELQPDGLVRSPRGWNFMDWVDWDSEPPDWNAVRWHSGSPPGGLPGGISIQLNFLVAWALDKLALLETWAGEPELAARAERLAASIARAAESAGWCPTQNALADDPARRHFSQHTQILALLSGRISPGKREALARALSAPGGPLLPATLSFSHYLLGAFAQEGLAAPFHERLEEWRLMPGRGMKTPYEVRWEYTRSDCHAWASHPLYHAFASILGIRPAAPGFSSVVIRPLLLPGATARGTMPHPEGEITAELQRTETGWRGFIELPKSVPGTFHPHGAAPRPFTGRLDLTSP